MPKKMRIALVHNVVFWLNNIPKVGQDHSPRDLICGEQLLNYRTVCRIPFGAYAQVHDDQSITNTMSSRTTGAISLGSVNNVQGTYRFLSLRTGEIVVRRTWTELSIPSEVIDRVTELTTNETNYVDYQNELDELDQEDEPDISDQNPESETAEDSLEEENQSTPNHIEHENEQITIDNEMQQHPTDQEGGDETLVLTGEGEENGNIHQQQPHHNYNLRANRGRDYSHRFTFLSVREGLKRFGQRGKEAILEKLKLFLSEQVFKRVRELTDEQ
jgi:hypothetical protein